MKANAELLTKVITAIAQNHNAEVFTTSSDDEDLSNYVGIMNCNVPTYSDMKMATEALVINADEVVGYIFGSASVELNSCLWKDEVDELTVSMCLRFGQFEQIVKELSTEK